MCGFELLDQQGNEEVGFMEANYALQGVSGWQK